MQKMLSAVKAHYAKHKRDLPWRHTHDPYRILVSEIMLQQTQAARVIPFYKQFLKQFPTARALARAPLSEVLAAWQGLGYNRRAKYLHQAAKVLSEAKAFAQRTDAEFWESLPGVGHYTAGAVQAFAFNKPVVIIETNIRTVFLHYIFPNKKSVPDSTLLPLIATALKRSRMQPRDFYAALMDYGSFLKSSGIRINHKSAHYHKQNAFKGSTRQLRGAIMRALIQSPMTIAQLVKTVSNIQPWQKNDIDSNLEQLENEHLIIKKGGRYSVAL